MHLLLNGWRRLGVVIASLWICAVLALAVFEYASNSRGIFVYPTIPEGTLIEGNKVTFPNGQVISLAEEDEFKLRRHAEQSMKLREQGSAVPPWELDWSNLEAVPKINQVRWLRASAAVLGPFIAWLFFEALVIIVAWVRRGFIGARHDA